MSDIKSVIERKRKDYYIECEKARFMLESYLSGFAYKNNNNLHRYINEISEKYNQRLKRSFPVNFLSPIVDEIKNSIFSKDVIRDGEKNEYLNRFINNATLDNKPLQETMKRIATLGSFLKIGVLVEGSDSDKLQKLDIQNSSISRELKEKERLYPNVKIFLPNQILNYSIGNELNWVLLDYSYYDDTDFYDQYDVKKYVLYTKNYWHSFTYSKDQSEPVESHYDHNLGQVPFKFFYQKDIDGNNVSESVYDDIVLQQNSIYNYYSLIDESLYSSIFTYMLIQEPDLNIIMDQESKKQFREKPFDMKGNVLTYAPGCATPSLLKNDFVNIPIVLDLIDKITKDIYRKVGKFLDTNNFYAQSGAAKVIDNEQRTQNIINFSMQLQEIENWILSTVYKFETKEIMPETFESIYPNQFDMIDLTEKITNSLQLKNIYTGKSDKAVNLLLSTLFKDVMRNKVTEKEIKEVDKEINTINVYEPLKNIDEEEKEEVTE